MSRYKWEVIIPKTGTRFSIHEDREAADFWANFLDGAVVVPFDPEEE